MQPATYSFGIYVHIAYLSTTENVHQVLGLNVLWHVSVSHTEQMSVQICVHAQGTCCLESFGEIHLLRLPYKWGAPVHGFSFGSNRGEIMLNVTAVCFSMYCITNNGCKALLYLMWSCEPFYKLVKS